MTPATPAELVAEALAHAEKATPAERLPGSMATTHRCISICASSWEVIGAVSFATNDVRDGDYLRRDVVEAALAHLAARVVAERERAERAERTSGLLQRRINALRGALERLTRDWKFKKDSGGHRGFASRALVFDARRFHGTITPEELAEEAEEAGEGVGRG